MESDVPLPKQYDSSCNCVKKKCLLLIGDRIGQNLRFQKLISKKNTLQKVLAPFQNLFLNTPLLSMTLFTPSTAPKNSLANLSLQLSYLLYLTASTLQPFLFGQAQFQRSITAHE